jgi:hypothetical protein
VVSSRNAAGQSLGVLVFGTGQQAIPWGQGQTFHCIATPTGRAALQTSAGTAGACDGSFAVDLNALWQADPSQRPAAGADLSIQLWYRDPQGQGNQAASFSNAVRVEVCP